MRTITDQPFLDEAVAAVFAGFDSGGKGAAPPACAR